MQRVLIVDDSSATRAYVRAALEEDADRGVQEAAGGFVVTEASSGFDALRILPREQFDLFVIDINMPNINGLELISFIRNSVMHRTTPLLIISTEASERDKSRAFALGADAYLAKPFSTEALNTAIANLRSGQSRGTPSPRQ